MASYKKTKNLLSNRDVYSKFYGDFRGVDFSNDHTRVSENRFAYLVNMYKDYQSAQGQAIETIPGFRRRISELGGKIYGIHPFSYRDAEDKIKNVVLIHAGTNLYSWAWEEGEEKKVIREEMNTRKSTSFIMNNRIYIIDGECYIYYDGTDVINMRSNPATSGVYIPTTYINITPGCDMKEQEYEQRNIIQPQFKCTFVAYPKGEVYEEGVTTFSLPENNVEIIAVWLNDEGLTATTHYSFDGNNTISLTNEGIGKLKEKSIITVQASKTTSMFQHGGSPVDGRGVIEKCTLSCVFDNRVFLSGNPNYPNHIFWCMLNSTGQPDPLYFGIMNYQQDGIGNSPITGMIPIADALMVLKNDTQQDGSVYYHTPQLTGEDLYTKIYPSTPGLNGVGCLGACTNFLDDPVFISRLGLEAVGQLSVRYERAIEHRSSLVDAKLVILGEEALKNAVLEEWNGYLLLLVDGKIFMADSRQRYTHETGVMQYEWYYLDDIGVYDENDKFHKAVTLKTINGNIFFGTENGVICSFNFDMRESDGCIPPRFYSFDDRTIFCGAATKMDCCGIPHLTKSTVKKSTVIKTKAVVSSAIKVMVRTNKKPYQQIARINTNKLDFNDVDFNDFTFVTEDETIFAIKEKEKQWVEKQYYLFSDEYCKPFSLYYISYRYSVAGRIKN